VRAAFVQTLVELARKDERVVLLTGDLGFRALEPFRDAYPERFFNVGVAEQNMLGLATGLAEAGYTPYCYSIATFATLLGGAILTEETFNWPGIGSELVRYLNERDYIAVQGLVTVFAIAVVVVSVLIDVVNAFVDPRVRY